MTGQPVAPDVPAGDSAQDGTAPSLIPEKIPPAIDEGAEKDIAPVPESGDEPKQDTVQSATAGAESEELETLKAQLAALQDDHAVMNMIRNDPRAAEFLDAHFKGKDPSHVPEPAGEDETAVAAELREVKSQLAALAGQFQRSNAEMALAQFAAQNPVVKNPKVAQKMQEILRAPGCESLSLQRTLTLALSELGVNADDVEKATGLRPSETGVAPRAEESSDSDDLQERIDSQGSFESALDLTLRETAKEQGFL